jgi:phosphatidylglycerophosphate synthase
MERAPILSLPNLVSTSRFVLAIAFVAAESAPVRLALLIGASVSDMLDGWLARRTRVASRFGALLDPVADRFFVLAVVGSYVAGGQLGAWQAAAILFRDIMSVIGWFVARTVSWLRPVTFRARPLGKAVTVLQVAVFAAVLLLPRAVGALVIVVALLGLAASIDYTLMLWRERDRDRHAAAARA